MKWVKRIGIALIALLAVCVGVPSAVGAMMAREHVASGDIVVPAPIEAVWATVVDYEAMPQWWPQRGAITPLAEAGTFREQADDFTLTYRFRDIEPPRRLVVDLQDDAGYFGGTWTYELAPAGAGTKVTITEAGWAGPGFFRFMLWAFGADGTLRDCLAALHAKHAG